jgi:hypothetical protein
MMKELTLEQMETLQPGGSKVLDCVSQIASGMSLLGGLAAIGIFAITPVGWGLLALSAVGFVASVASNPTACDE